LIQILLLFIIWHGAAFAQVASEGAQYPEIARLGPSSYCNPYFGFRVHFPSEYRAERIHLPVQPHGRHVLLALHIERLYHEAELIVAATEDGKEDAAERAAKMHSREAHDHRKIPSGPHGTEIGGKKLYRVRVSEDGLEAAGEDSYFMEERGNVLHFAIYSHDPELSSALASLIHHMEFFEPGAEGCAADDAGEHLFYGPALPTEMVDEMIRARPADRVPAGVVTGRTFRAPAMGVRVELPAHWQPLPAEESYRVIELMRDPTEDEESSDRRRVLFRSCARVLFAAHDPQTEIIPEVHPGLVVAAMPRGCVPDLIFPASTEDHEGTEEFANLCARSIGLNLLHHGRLLRNPSGRLIFHLDGALPYRVTGEPLLRRFSLRVSAAMQGRWVLFVYVVSPSPSAQREVESHIRFETPAQ
jgi:hypothetical protein